MSTEPLTYMGTSPCSENQLLNQLEEKLGGDLTDDERAFLLSSDDVKLKIKQEQVQEQRQRLDELSKLLELLQTLNANVHSQDQNLAEISARIVKTVDEMIPAANDNLSKAL